VNLTAKVMLTLALVIGVALLTASLLIGRSAGAAYRNYVAGSRHQRLEQAAALAGQLYAETGSWAEVQAQLNQVEGMPGHQGQGRGQGKRRGQEMEQTHPGQGGPAGGDYLLVDSQSGEPLVDDGPPLDAEMLISAAPVVVNGEEVARLAAVAPLDAMGSAEQAMLEQVQRAILWSALVAAGVALLLGALLVSSILRPLRRLEEGVARVAHGELDARVPVQSKDEIGQLATQFNRMAANLQEQEALRQRLVGDIAHELRTPLSVVQGGLQAILDGVYPLEMDEVRTIYDETQLLSRLISDLHELAQAEAGRLPLVRQPIAAETALIQMAARFRSLAEPRAIEMRVEPPAPPLSVDADPDRLQQILHNLLGNAVRHTPDGGWIELGAETADDKWVRFRVSNSGPGIPPAQLPHVFERFYRGDASRTRGEQETAEDVKDFDYTSGAGLGLAIVKALALAHGGQVGVESVVDERTTFWFELPQVEEMRS
jgi:signal transduction histidine kinase